MYNYLSSFSQHNLGIMKQTQEKRKKILRKNPQTYIFTNKHTYSAYTRYKKNDVELVISLLYSVTFLRAHSGPSENNWSFLSHPLLDLSLEYFFIFFRTLWDAEQLSRGRADDPRWGVFGCGHRRVPAGDEPHSVPPAGVRWNGRPGPYCRATADALSWCHPTGECTHIHILAQHLFFQQRLAVLLVKKQVITRGHRVVLGLKR